MKLDSITTKATILAIAVSEKLAKHFSKLSGSLYDFAYSAPPRGRLLYAMGDVCAGIALTLAERLGSAGQALEYWAAQRGSVLGY